VCVTWLLPTKLPASETGESGTARQVSERFDREPCNETGEREGNQLPCQGMEGRSLLSVVRATMALAAGVLASKFWVVRFREMGFWESQQRGRLSYLQNDQLPSNLHA